MNAAPSHSIKRVSSAAPVPTRSLESTASSAKSTTARSTSALPGALQALASAHPSDLRQHQLLELEKIRLLFEQNNLSFSDAAFERGLLVPEDRPVLECVQNLPLAGSRLLPNPLVDVRLKKRVVKKKKKRAKTKGSSGGNKKTKGSKAPKSGRAKLKSS